MFSKSKLALLILALLKFSPVKADTKELSILEVRRSIPMTDNEVIYKDFYISGGTSAGIKKNQVVMVLRKSEVKDSTGQQILGQVEIPVGQLKVIAVYGNIAVAREVALVPRESEPLLDMFFMMVGDRVATP